MPLLGQFVLPAPGAARTFFYAPRPEAIFIIEDERTGKTRTVSGDDARNLPTPEIYGLYACASDNTKWELVSSAYDFKHVLQMPDGTLCAIAAEQQARNWKERVIRSTDDGKTWVDITHNAFDGMSHTHGMIPDPDHPGLFCLLFWGAREYIMQAQDDRFQWHLEKESDWDKRHPTEQPFFATHFTVSGMAPFDYSLEATFGNYFRFDFGNKTSLDAFDLAADKAQYMFALDGPKNVTVTLSFGREDHAAAIMDLKDASDFWGLKVEAPDGTRTIVQSVAERDASRQTRRKYEQDPALVKTEVIAGKPYSRTLNLNDFHAFSKPGVYKVQLIYTLPFYNYGEGRARWNGSFGGTMFTAMIK